MKNLTTLVLGGGRGTRLYPLTKYRSKPAVPLAAKYRLIDIPLSNCINSGMNRIYVLTQFMSVSLHRHIRQTYRFDAFNGGFVELLAAQQTMEAGTDWYEGTADAVRKNMKYFDQPGIDYVLILSGDQLYRMDYCDMLKTHQQSKADVTIAALPVTRQEAGSLGVMRIDDTGRVAGFLEKPQTDKEIDLVRTDPAWIDARGIESKGRECLASMGIYLFDRKFLVDVLTKTAYQDFGKEVFPAAFRSRHVQAHLYDDYWEDIGTIKAYFDSTLALASSNPPFDFYVPDSPIYSRARFLPPTILDGATIKESMIADGCKIGKGAIIENSVIGLRCQIGENVKIRNSIVMGADFYETESQRNGRTAVGIGKGSLIEGAILDKNCRVGENVRIVNVAGIENGEDAEDCVIRDQIPIVIKEATLPNGWKLEDRTH
jgi:glucose-1-phosphate adenylyltransferase